METSFVDRIVEHHSVDSVAPSLPRPVPPHVAVSWALNEVSGALRDSTLNGAALIGSERRNFATNVSDLIGLLRPAMVGSEWLMPPDAIEDTLRSTLGKAAQLRSEWISDMKNIATVVNEASSGLGVHFVLAIGRQTDVVLDSHRGRHIDYVKLAAIVSYVGGTTNFYDSGDVLFDEAQGRQEGMARQLGRSAGRFRPFNLGLREGAPVYRLHPGEVLFFRGSEHNPRAGLVHSAPLYENSVDADSLRVVFSAFVPE